MMKASLPHHYYENLPKEQRRIIDRWKDKRQFMIQELTRKLVESAVGADTPLGQRGTPFLKVLVRTINHSQNGRKMKDFESKEAMLTIWHVTEEQLNLLREGVVIRVENVGVKSSLRDGRIQLTANAKTRMEHLNPQPPKWTLESAGFKERNLFSMLKVHAIARKLNTPKLQFSAPEIDLIGCVLKVTSFERESITTTHMYLTDMSGLILRIDRDFDENSLHQTRDQWISKTAHGKIGTIMALQDLRIISFDNSENCAVAVWTQSSRMFGRGKGQERIQQLRTWSTSMDGKRFCDMIGNNMDSPILLLGRFSPHTYSTAGYVMNISLYEETDLEDFQENMFSPQQFNHFSMAIDCGSSKLCYADISLQVLYNFLKSIYQSKTPNEKYPAMKISPDELYSCNQNMLSTVTKYFREHTFLFQFILRKKPNSNINIDSLFSYEVVQIKRVDAGNLCEQIMNLDL